MQLLNKLVNSKDIDSNASFNTQELRFFIALDLAILISFITCFTFFISYERELNFYFLPSGKFGS